MKLTSVKSAMDCQTKNKSILTKLQIDQRYSTVVQKRILKYFGQVIDRDNDSFERLEVQKEQDPKLGISNQNQVTPGIDKNVSTYVRNAEDRHKWRQLIYSRSFSL